jgi:hypothetical protein
VPPLAQRKGRHHLRIGLVLAENEIPHPESVLQAARKSSGE